MRRVRGFSLAEIMLALGLAVMTYGIVSGITVQLHRAARKAERAAEARLSALRATEQLRWQLRCLALPPSALAPPGAPLSPAPAPSPLPSSPGVGPLIPSALLARRTPQADRDLLLFRTTARARGVGATEVGYRILEDPQGAPYLAYREFPYAEPSGLRREEPTPEAPWRVLSPEVHGLRLEFSTDGQLWQREWDAPLAPRGVRARLRLSQGEELSLEIEPGVTSPRW